MADTTFIDGTVVTADWLNAINDFVYTDGASKTYVAAAITTSETTTNAAIVLKSNIASPTFTGVPAAPTAAVDTNTTQVATTGYVIGQTYAKVASPTFTGTPLSTTAATDTNTTQIATTAYVVGQGYAKLASPALTGTPTVPTATLGTNTTQAASTAFVIANSGAMVLLSTVSASGTATADIETTFDSTYDSYLIVASGVRTSSASVLYCRLKLGGSYLAADYAYHTSQVASNTSADVYDSSVSSAAAHIMICTNSIGNDADDICNFNLHIYKPASTTERKPIHWEGTNSSSTTLVEHLLGSGVHIANTALTGVRFLTAAGNITGTFRLYGIKNA